MLLKEIFWSEHPLALKMKLLWSALLVINMISVTCVVFLSVAKAHHWLCSLIFIFFLQYSNLTTQTLAETVPLMLILVMTGKLPNLPQDC